MNTVLSSLASVRPQQLEQDIGSDLPALLGSSPSGPSLHLPSPLPASWSFLIGESFPASQPCQWTPLSVLRETVSVLYGRWCHVALGAVRKWLGAEADWHLNSHPWSAPGSTVTDCAGFSSVKKQSARCSLWLPWAVGGWSLILVPSVAAPLGLSGIRGARGQHAAGSDL